MQLALGENGEHTWTVPELHDWVGAAVARAMPDTVWIEGEIANLNRSRQGHAYFTLVEAGADHAAPEHGLSVTLFKWNRDKVNLQIKRGGGSVRIEDGVRVRIRGTVELYGRRMQVQFKMIAIDPVFTLGDLAAQRARILAELSAEGLLDANGRCQIPLLSLRVGFVTSTGSAADADVTETLVASGFGFVVLRCDARVQGLDAPASVVAAIETLTALGPDLIIVARGGGARTDLAAFDSGLIARAIATSTVAVWTGIGHEIDRSIADDCAHTAFKTPTACATALVERVTAARDRVEFQWEEICTAATGRLKVASDLLTDQRRSVRSATRSGLDQRSQHLDHVVARLGRSAHRRVSGATTEMATACSSLDRQAAAVTTTAGQAIAATALTARASAGARLTSAGTRLDLAALRVRADDPRRLLERGWSMTRGPDGRLIRSVTDTTEGASVITTLADGSIRATIDSIVPEER